MQLSPEEKVKECIQSARDYFKPERPNITLEHNLAEVKEEWFEGFPYKANEKCERNTVKYIYRLS